MDLHGIYPALVTPFDCYGEVNYDALEKLVQQLLNDGADGFYVTGSTGECFLLSDDERIKITAKVTESVNGRVPVIAHIGKIGAKQAVSLSKAVEKIGVSAISSVPPFYYHFSFDEISRYYEELSSAVDLPLVLYHFPQSSDVAIDAEKLQKLTSCCRIGGLKYTDSNLYELEKIRRHFPNLKIMYGRDESFLYSLPIGIDGAIGSTYNFMLKKYKRILLAYQQGDMNTAESLQHEACAIIDIILKTRDISAAKYLLQRKGIPCGDCRLPFHPLTAAEKMLLDQIGDLN